ncbi:MAG: (2Fe-2S) ferredoxin domain-containing protein [Armatimonadetes bacterium]|nr:(2Fe-2S) ferredoxin domain-containing protein [Armatimonadota bacterium]
MKTLDDLKRVREEALKAMSVRESGHATKVTVAMGTCGIAAGARETMSALLDELGKRGISDVTVTQTGCKGLCEQEPLVEVTRKGQEPVTYGHVSADKARRIVAEHIVNGTVVGDLVVTK